MAVQSGAAPHQAWLICNGQWPLLSGSVTQHGTRETSTFSADLPLNYPGAYAALSGISGPTQASVYIECVAGAGTLISGVVDEVEAHFGEAGCSIHVSGRDASAKLHNTKLSKQWLNKQTTEVVQDVCSAAGLGCAVSATGSMAGKKIKQDFSKLADNTSAAQILAKCAEQDGARWYVDSSGTLHYLDGDGSEGSYSVSYQAGPPIVADFLSLTCRHNIQLSQGVKVTVHSWHPKDHKAYKGESGGGPLAYDYHLPSLNQDQANTYAKSKAKEHGRHQYSASAECAGDPSINAGMALVVSGTGAFDQAYIIDSIAHKFGYGGYTMSISGKTGGGGA